MGSTSTPAHDLGDEHLLPETGAVGRDPAAGHDRVVEALGQVHGLELGQRQLDQFDADRAQFLVLPLELALARTFVEAFATGLVVLLSVVSARKCLLARHESALFRMLARRAQARTAARIAGLPTGPDHGRCRTMSTTVAPKDHSPMLTADGADLLALVELALAEARALGASQAEAAISMDVGLSVSARLGEVETIEYQRDRGMGVTVYFGTRKGSASTGDLGAAALRETVAKACSIAKYTAEDPCAGLPDPDDACAGRARARSLAPVGDIAGARMRHGDRVRSRCDGGRHQAHHQFGRRCGQHASRPASVRQLARLPRGLSWHRAQHQLLGARHRRRADGA